MIEQKQRILLRVTPDAAERIAGHKSRCRGATVAKAWRSDRGDVLVRCRGCSRVGVVDESCVVQPEKPAFSRFVCREHYAPVTPRGKGCPRCEGRVKPKPKDEDEDGS